MPFISGAIEVSDQQPTLLEQSVSNLFVGLVKNVGKRTVFFGAEDVSVDTGFPLEPGEAIEADLESKQVVYAIAGQGGTELRWLTVT